MDAKPIQTDPFATGVINLGGTAGTKVGGGRYCLKRLLGRGGMGIVWLAHDERLGSNVALKFLPAQIRYDAAALDDLRRETARSRKLTHPNIVRIHDLYEAPEEEAFISMEYIDGRNLADLRVEQSSRVFTWSFLKPLVTQLCAGLEYAHSENIIHRDLKPGNLMLEAKGRLKLADFGIARAMSDTMNGTSISQTSGTVLYMSPQQMDGDPPRATDDIYALGATLYELLTGKPPFYTGNIVHQVRNVSPRPMHERLAELEHANEIPANVEKVILSCLSKNAAERPQTAAEVSRLLCEEKLKLVETKHNLPVETRPSSVWPPPVEATTSRRFKVRWLIAGLVCAVGLAAWSHFKKQQPLKVAARTAATSAAKVSTAPVVEPAPPVLQQTNIVSPLIAPSPVTKAVRPSTAVASPPSVPETKPAATEVQQAPASLVGADSLKSSEPPKPTIQIQKSSPAPEPTRSAQKPVAITITRNKPTALQLLQKGNTHVSARSKNKVLQISSNRSPVDEPPRSWRLLYYDDKTTYNAVEVRFEDGEMERVHEPNRLLELFTFASSKTLDLAKVKIDSDAAIRVAVAECPTEVGTVKQIEAKLERGYGGLPVWNIKLFGIPTGKLVEDASLGYVIVLAEDGKVLKKDIAVKTEKPVAKK